jgi:glycosyltransferase involved in cell wall biosynthesis
VPLLLDLTHTSHTRARTGIQRVARALRRELAGRAEPICFDPYERRWRPLEAWEVDTLTALGPSAGRGARWPMVARLRGLRRRRFGPASRLAGAEPGAGALFPEIFSAETAAHLDDLAGAVSGPRVALFHDAIALQYPEFTPRSTVARFPGYLQELLRFDGVAAVSEASRQSLSRYWDWLGASQRPRLATLTLGLDPAPPDYPPPAESATPTVLCVGSIEARKNHGALLDACEALWSGGARFRLRLVGLANAETGAAAVRRIDALRAAGRPLEYSGALDEDGLENAYRACAFTVYPSLAEGYGLPVAESLARGRPCVCREDGALGEIARGGGCVLLRAADAAELAGALGRLLAAPQERAALAAAARERRFKTWASYAAELVGWMGSL